MCFCKLILHVEHSGVRSWEGDAQSCALSGTEGEGPANGGAWWNGGIPLPERSP